MPDQEQRKIQTQSAAKGDQLQPVAKPYMTFNPPPIAMAAGVDDIKYDFNFGARVQVPKGDYRVRLFDNTAKVALYDAAANGTIVTSTKRYFVDFSIEVLKKKPKKNKEDKKEKDEWESIFKHDYNAKDKNVLMKFPDSAMGDVLAWFPYAEEFRKKHQCKLFCAMNPKFSSILKAGYPNITFLETEAHPDNLYASYYIGLFWPWDNHDLQPLDWRVVGLQKHAAYLLGVEPTEQRVILKPSKKPRQIKEKYVCIATQATAQCKYWNNAYGWLGVVEYLKKLGYRVLCIDRDKITIAGIHGNTIPYGAEDFTGNKPLQERVDLLAHADFFIGLTSGLSWLAWGVGIPVIMVVGYTAPGTEFYTPYRVQHFHTCNSCCNDMSLTHKYNDFGYCPKHGNTDREFECTRFISTEFVTATIDKVIKDHNLK